MSWVYEYYWGTSNSQQDVNADEKRPVVEEQNEEEKK